MGVVAPLSFQQRGSEVRLDYRESMEQWPFTWFQRYTVPIATPSLRHLVFPITDTDFVVRAYMLDTSTTPTDFSGQGPFTSSEFSIA